MQPRNATSGKIPVAFAYAAWADDSGENEVSKKHPATAVLGTP